MQSELRPSSEALQFSPQETAGPLQLTFMPDVVSTYLELHKELVQGFAPWHVQDYLNGIEKATESLSTGLKFTPDALMKAQLLPFCSNTQYCFYKISCLKIISCSDHTLKTL